MIGTALILGIAASLHCILMCSPLAVAVTGGSRHGVRKLFYNGGRLLTYGILGAFMAAFGTLLDFSGFQLILTVALAVGLLAMGLAGVSGITVPFITPLVARLTLFIKVTFQRYLQKKTRSSIFFLGMVNGLLPCGVTYLALSYCLTVAGPLDGFNFMLWFGVGTLPAMLGLTSVLSFTIRRFSLNASSVTRFSYILLALIMVARLAISRHDEIHHAVSEGVILLCQ